jgi:putative membrane protein
VSDAPRVFDPGLQPERTLLSWQRTTLALMVGIAAAVHYVAPDLGGPVAVFAGIVGIALAIAAYAGAHRRYTRTARELLASATLRTVSAWPLLLLAVTCVLGGLIAVAFAVVVLL